jgi:hypothetical protein
MSSHGTNNNGPQRPRVAMNLAENAAVRVVSGLRPKKRATTTAPLPLAAQPHNPSLYHLPRAPRQACVNPLDRFCQLLLDWRFLADLATQKRGGGSSSAVNISRSSSSSSSSSSMSVAAVVHEELRPIPISFTDYDAYLQHWEPALIDEIKANVLSNAPQNTRPPPPQSSSSGGGGSGRQFVAAVSALSSASGGGADSPLVTLNCHFNDTPTTAAPTAAAGGGGERGVRPERAGVGVMDLVLLLRPPLTHATTATAGNSSLPTHHRIPVIFNTSHLFFIPHFSVRGPGGPHAPAGRDFRAPGLGHGAGLGHLEHALRRLPRPRGQGCPAALGRPRSRRRRR